jgi:LmbE family N-acetylglucosaminyl deacetylase
VDAALRLRQLDGVKRVLLIGAHPDDEDSALLAAMARGMGVETAYLSLTRGDGGQNLIGSELSVELGIVRTGELVAARAIDGGQQFFTRALDYGFSKSAEEAFSHWPRETLLGDMVWVIRNFRPQVIVSAFSGTPADGHGHHQVAGILAPEAFAAASDPTRFPEQLAFVQLWQPTKLFRRARRDPPGTPVTVVQTGVFDPLLGRSWYQVAMEGRSRHRSQDMGMAQPLGSRASDLVLLESTTTVEPGAGLFAGVDTALSDLTAGLGPRERATADEHMRVYREAIHQAEASLGVSDPGQAVPHFARALHALADLAGSEGEDGARATKLARTITHHTALARAAMLSAASIVVEAVAGDSQLVPGAQTTVTIRVWNGGRYAVTQALPELRLPAGWTATAIAAVGPQGRRGRPPLVQLRSPDEVARSGMIDPGEVAAWSFRIEVPTDAPPTDPYFVRQPRDGDLYHWPDDPALRGLPMGPPLIQGGASLQVELAHGEPPVAASSVAEALFVGVDQASGEYREPVLVVPALSVAIDQATMAWPIADMEPREVAVRLRGEAEKSVQGSVRLEAPPGWTVEPASVPFAVEGRGSVMSAAFRVRPPEGGAVGKVVLRAVANGSGGGSWDHAIRTIEYPHIRRAVYVTPSQLTVTRLPVQISRGLRVGYIMGTGDGGFEALRQLGANAELLTHERVQAGDFSGFDVVVVGVRAYETRRDLVAANARLLDFARAGGTVIVQYQQYQYANGGFAPYPVTINRPHDRVTEEKAPVRVLDASSPIFTTPNRITPEDFVGWAQERGLYFLGTWDDHFTPLLEMNDPGESPLHGSLLVAPMDKGIYVYTALAFFRQFPKAVPGAYRLFANLVSLDAEAWERHLQEGGAGR